MKLRLVIFILLLLTACSQLRTRDEVPAEQPFGEPPRPPEEPRIISPTPDFIKQGVPKIGLILGPGGIKTFAHAGVLEAFAKANMPIHAIVGLEWGSLVAALHSMQGQPYDAQWKLQKMQQNQLMDSGLFNSAKVADINKFSEFLEQVFGSAAAEAAKIPFFCPTISSNNYQQYWLERGSYVEILKKCLPFSPFPTASNQWTAVPYDIQGAVEKLHSKGANLIIFVDVVSFGDLFPKDRDAWYDSHLLWMQVRKLLQLQKNRVNEVVYVHTHEYNLLDFKSRQQLQTLGLKAGEDAVARLAKKYGF